MGLFGSPNVEKMKAKGDVSGLIKALRYDKDSSVRCNAAKTLGEMKDARAIEPLVALFKDPHSEIRKFSAEAVGKIAAHLEDAVPRTRAAAALITTLTDDDKDARETGSQALVKIGTVAVEPLKAALKAGNKDLRMAAVEVLGGMEDARVMEPLIAMLKDGDRDVRICAANVLGGIGDPRAAPGLVEAFQSAIGRMDKDGGQAATDALVRIGESSTEVISVELRNSVPEIRQRMVETLDRIGWQPGLDEVGARYWMEKGNYPKCVEIGAPAVEPLMSAFRSDNQIARISASEALEKIGSPAVESLIAALGEARLGLFAIKAMGGIKDDRCIAPLVARLQDKEVSIRFNAAKALEKIGWQPGQDPDGIRYCILTEQWDKCAAIGASAVEPLVAMLSDGDWSVRNKVRDALITIGAPSVEPLLAVLNDENWVVRKNAVEALGRIGEARSIGPLTAVLKDRDVCTLAVEALDLLGWKPGMDETGAYYWFAKKQLENCIAIGAPAIVPLINALRDVDKRVGALEALMKIGAPAFEPLVAALEDDDWIMRKAAAEILGRGGDVRSVKPLAAHLRDTDVNVRQAAAQALALLGALSVELLIPILKDKNEFARSQAAEILGQNGDARAVEPLLAALEDDRLSVRKSAARGLVHLYKSSHLPESERQRIVSLRKSFTAAHRDGLEHKNYNYDDNSSHRDVDVSGRGCYGMHDDSGRYNVHVDEDVHNDRGIGIEFPL